MDAEVNEYSLEYIKSTSPPADDAIIPLLKLVTDSNPDADLSVIEDAYIVARKMHEGQKRKSGEPYIIHPVAVAEILAELGVPSDVVAAGLLHDVVEDTSYPLNQIKKDFSESIAIMVDGVTKIDKLKIGKSEQFTESGKKIIDSVAAQRIAQAETFRKMILAMSRDIRVLVVKICDRLHNARTWKYVDNESAKRKARETLEIYAPLADRLGLTNIKDELEELSFRIVEPKIHDEIVNLVAQREEARRKYVQVVVSKVQKEIDRLQIKCDIAGRPKHYYSIYRKMVIRKTEFKEIYDLIGIRILTDKVSDCYAALGAIHALFTPIEGRFKDYIAVPKANMYQSLHTGVIGPDGRAVEFQIRTYEMHNNAEYGVAAHWKYKASGKSVLANEQGDKLINDRWLKQLVDLGEETKDSDEFLVDLQTDLKSEEVYVFTPQGKVQTLPVGATPIDFAYAIHTDIGRKATGAKVNGKLVPLSTKLQNGETVEIITSNNPDAHPSRDWVDFVVTNRAKIKIRQFFTKERRTESIELGRELLIKALRKKGLPITKLMAKDNMQKTATLLFYKTVDDFYNAIGEHQLSTEKARMRLSESAGLGGAESEASLAATQDAAIQKRSNKKQKEVSSSGVVIKGVDDIWVKFAKCCTPVPGDEIVGFITRGHGVSVHQVDCKSLATMAKEQPERLVDAAWSTAQLDTFRVNIQVSALDRQRLLLDITTRLNELGANILAVNTLTGKNRKATMKFSFEISDLRQLDLILHELTKIESVYDVFRVGSPA
ncbi:MAG: bifunctional (p)ppGpp synthetase/guanosine-3',5'-bis(diphosphate) 3'-pyrophosphohydrolase [Bifidobacteriaceae bacterium]|jgi:GTP pyrophosphokinase|nr:bifunctional (p)ppGpp synthetase/guanosine-3',5'-bis(diphosphate) 3'-pyrophosphohydrolase [Bifidobacteriaceae bacterium]